MVRRDGSDGEPPMSTPVEQLFNTIVEDIAKAPAIAELDWWRLSKFPLVPLAIPISTDTQYRVTQVGVDAAHKLTDQMWMERRDLRQTMSRKAFDRISFRAIGQAIQCTAGCLPEQAADPDGDDQGSTTFFENLAAEFSNTLDKLADGARGEVDQHIPCELFHTDQEVPAFSVGQIDFRPRADWIKRFVRDSETRGIVEQVERRELTRDEVRRRMEPDGGEAPGDALTAITFLGAYSWVGTVRTVGHEFGRSHEKASIVVGLAIDAVGLRFYTEEARRFAKAGRCRLHAEDRLATPVDGTRFIHGWSVHVPGLGSAPGELARVMREEDEFLRAAGRVLDVYLDHRKDSTGPVLVERWVNALYWFGEARREATDFMAVVKYGCALDGLSGACGDKGEITDFVKIALGLNNGDEPSGGALSVGEAVELVYGEGRSALAHGGVPGLLEDFSKARTLGDSLLATLFYPVTLALASLIADKGSPALTLKRGAAYRALKLRMEALGKGR